MSSSRFPIGRGSDDVSAGDQAGGPCSTFLPGLLFTPFAAQKRQRSVGALIVPVKPELRVPRATVVGEAMPKRSYPFADSSPVQLKTRVRLKELSQGVLGERYRREIFEKTKQLLFKGAQTYMNNACSSSAMGTYLIAQYPESCIDKSEMCSWHSCNGQMLIGQDGKLRQPCASEMVVPVGVSKACSSCIRTVDIKDVCTQCDQYICQNCSKLCSCCSTIVCSLCSIIESEDVGDQIFCSGCSMYK
ncbi:apoptosis regulatory protein Siva [Ahaetulla prasina]|uniref:apoptosis regulatory protein Siva n=1 Tax=Ahaetulla prasina TaxID=499056 RepID=UPI00264A27C7|nr:apoptosis regulatory protein Siva [Ahaetulla prasina]